MKKGLGRILSLCLLIAIFVSGLTSCGTKAESIALSKTSMTMKTGDTEVLTATITPEDTSDKTVVWTSSSPAIASVSELGVVTALTHGTCTITATCGDVSASVTVKVKKPVESISLNKNTLTVKEGSTVSLSPTITPSESSGSVITWTSSDTDIATVDSDGVITGEKPGTCTITANCEGKTDKAEVTVYPDFKKIYDGVADKTGITIGSDNSYIAADTNRYDLDDFSSSTVWSTIKDLNRKLGLPASIDNDMNTTSWSMGVQKEIYEDIGIEVTWTYHPDMGLEVKYKLIV